MQFLLSEKGQRAPVLAGNSSLADHFKAAYATSHDTSFRLTSCPHPPPPLPPGDPFYISIVGGKVAVITASLTFALPVSIAVFPQEARFEADSLEPELHNLRLKDGSRDVKYLYANKGL